MNDKITILAICGSTRKASFNLNLIKAIAGLNDDKFIITIFEGLVEIPSFNPDSDNEQAPQRVKDFRNKIREARGVLICTPEYAMGVPGTLKNAIDWTVSSMEFSEKPTALITASLSGEMAHRSLLETLKVLEAQMTGDTQIIVPFVKTKVTEDCRITDEKTLADIARLMHSLEKMCSYE